MLRLHSCPLLLALLIACLPGCSREAQVAQVHALEAKLASVIRQDASKNGFFLQHAALCGVDDNQIQGMLENREEEYKFAQLTGLMTAAALDELYEAGAQEARDKPLSEEKCKVLATRVLPELDPVHRQTAQMLRELPPRRPKNL